MRLIDADALIETMKRVEEEYEDAMACPSWWTAYNVIKEQPTAYDVEKVVAELERNGQKMSEAKGNPWDSSDHKYYKAISVKKAIDIVRKGGVE